MRDKEDELRERLAREPADWEALRRLARLVGSIRGRKDEAVELWSRCLQGADPSERGGALLALARAQIEARSNVDAISTLRRCTAEYPGHIEAFDLLGELLRSTGRFNEAVEALEAAARLDPEAIRPRAALATCLNALGRQSEAQQVLMELQRLGSADPAVAALVRELQQRSGQ